MALWQWSTTPASNGTAGLIDWAEGQPPSTVNDSARQMMADVATWFQTPEWLNYGLTPTFVSATQFSTPNNQTGIYAVGRRVRAFVTVFASLTTVTVTWDGTSALDSGVSEVDVGILNPSAPSLSELPSFSVGNMTVSGALTLSEGTSPNVSSIKFGDGTGWKLNFTTMAGIAAAILQDTGNFTAAGNITSNSDERLKKDWGDLPDDFVNRLAEVKFGTFTRIRTGSREAGVSAQSLRDLLPETVLEGDDGILSVAYANAALVSCIALAQHTIRLSNEVERLRALLEPVK
jgi:hypothetical protein